MAGFFDMLQPSELLQVPAKMRPFLDQSRGADEAPSWGEYAFGFAAAFDELYEVATRASPRGEYLLPPITFLARHSIELALKETIAFLAVRSAMPPMTDGHELVPLWHHMLDQVRECGFPTDDPWTRYCEKLVRHLHENDRGGMRFRYPSDQLGNPYRPVAINLEALGSAHRHLTRYYDGVASLVDVGGDPFG